MKTEAAQNRKALGPDNPPPGYVYVGPVRKRRRAWCNRIGEPVDLGQGCVVRNRLGTAGFYFHFEVREPNDRGSGGKPTEDAHV